MADAAKALLRARLSGQAPVPLIGLEQHVRSITDLLDRAITHAESNSVLISGPRGVGKTAIVNLALENLKEKYANQERAYLVVQLDGLVLTDDRVALQEIAYQLAVEQQIEKKTFGSYAETLSFLLSALRKGDTSTMPIILILNEFDQFALHPKQTLLYNLFDIVQSPSSPIVVVGVTSRLDTVEMLEKRVKSRFSHRQMWIAPVETFETFRDILLTALTLPLDGLIDNDYASQFNAIVKQLGEDESFLSTLLTLFQLSKDVSSVFRLAFDVICALPDDGLSLNGGLFKAKCMMMMSDPKVDILLGISLLELALIIAMRHLIDKKEQSTFNFEMVYEEYRDFMKKSTSLTVERYSKPVALKAFDQLRSLELVKSVNASWSAIEFTMVTLQLDPSQIEQAINHRPDCPVFLKRWATQWVE